MNVRLALAALLALAACTKTEVAMVKAASCTVTPGGQLTVENAWVRAQSDASGMSAAYFTLCNAGAEPVTIEGLTTPVAGLVEFHETTRDTNGIASMAPIGAVTLAPGEKIDFAPGGKHAMLMNLAGPIAEDAVTTLTLELASGEQITAQAKSVSAAEAAGHAH